MIVDKVKVPEVFVPVRITLESKEEADKMWHILNYAPGYENYDGVGKGITTLDLSHFHTALWEAFSLKHDLPDG